jgi:hypothetical protein
MGNIHQKRFASLRPLQMAILAAFAAEKDPRKQRVLNDLSYLVSRMRVDALNGR